MINKSRIDELLGRAERLEDITLQYGPVLAAVIFLIALAMAAGAFWMMGGEDISTRKELGLRSGVLVSGAVAAAALVNCFFPHMRRIRMTPETLEASSTLGFYYRAPWSEIKDFWTHRSGVSFTITPKGAKWRKFRSVQPLHYGLSGANMVKLLETYRAAAVKAAR